MPITPVDLTDTFDVWRTRTNQIITLSESTNTAVTAAFSKANAANVLAFNTGIGANAYATAATAGANAYMISVQNGSNTAVGTGANAFASATIAGANSAVGTGANAFATAATAGANAYMISVQNGSNTAVGTGANAFTSATIAGANSAVGTGANTYLLATLSGANSAVGTGANTVGIAAFAKANAAFANTTGTLNGSLTTSGSISDNIGGIRVVPVNSQTSAYVLVKSDVGKFISITTGGVTVPNAVFSTGENISIYNDSSSSQTITSASSITMYRVGSSTTGNRTLAQRGFATILCVAANTFVISGGGLT